MKMIEITEMTDKQLSDKLAEEQLNLLKLKISHSVSSLDNPMRISDSRKTVARLYTEINKRKDATNQ